MTVQPDYGVIFDMDGVLIDSFEPHRRSWQRMAREHGIQMTDEQFAITFGRTSRDIIHHFWGDTLTPEQMREMDDRKEAIFRDLLSEHIPTMPGAVELIDDLYGHGFRLAIGSSGPPANVQLVAQSLGLANRLAGIVTGADVTRGKPDPQVFLLAAERMHLAPDRCAVVEDAVHGITAARRAGMRAIALTGTAPREAFGAADLVVDRLQELRAADIATLIDRDSKR
jgi:beta-phosphoglucomutase